MRTYADLLQLYEQSPPWQPLPPATGDATATAAGEQSPDRPSQDRLDFFADQQIAAALKIDVLGQREDGTIEVYSEHLHRTVAFKGLDRIKYPQMLQFFGTPVRRAVSKTNEDHAPGMYPISDVRDAIGHLASKSLLSDETKLGIGCWPIDAADADDPTGIVLVNSSEAMHYDGNGQIERVTHPRHSGHLLSFESGAKPWFDHDRLAGMLAAAADPQFRAKAVDDLTQLFNRWRWSHPTHHPFVMAGLALATWVQSLWPWRPRIDILGGTNTGKSMLCRALAGLYGELAIMTSDTTAAGLRQKICNSAAVVIVDEVDAKNRAKMARQREILEMLRSASRGTSAIRGTGSGKAIEFTLRHLVWVAGISVNYDDQADRNRAIRLDLLPPKAELAGKLTIPPPAELAALGQRCLAVALRCVLNARKLAGRLKDTKVEGVDQRAVESFAVPTAMLSTAIGFNGLTPEQLLAEMASGTRDESDEMESDEVSLMSDVLGATIQAGTIRQTVAQAVEFVRSPANQPTEREAWRRALEASGVKLTIGLQSTISFAYTLIRRKLLHGTRWEGQPVDQYLKRFEHRDLGRFRCGSHVVRGATFPYEWFREQFMGDEADEHEDGAFIDTSF